MGFWIPGSPPRERRGTRSWDPDQTGNASKRTLSMRWNLTAAAGLSLFFAFAQALDAEASEITVCAARAIATVLAEVGPQFEKETGHKLKVVSTKNVRFLNKPEAEEAFDVLVSAPPEFIDDLIK